MRGSRNGYHFLNLERRAFLQTLFDCLPDKAVVKTQQYITDILESEEGVKVACADGRTEQGDIVVGCDGVNSTVRQAIWTIANGTMPGHITSSEVSSKICAVTCQHY